MGRTPKPILLLLALCLLASLCACGAQTPAENAAPSDPAPPRSETGAGDVPGEDATEDAAPLSATAASAADGLEGSYYNDYLRLTLTLDGNGGCTLTGDGANAVGTYTRGASGELMLTLDGVRKTAEIDEDGDITIEGRAGYFLRDWDFWGITAAEAGVVPEDIPDNTGVTDNGDGTYRFRDFENAIAFTYPAGMSVLRGKLIGGGAVTDGSGGYVTGRNVTELYSTAKSTDDEFLEDYVRTFVFSDFRLLYDSLRGFENLTLLHEGIEGRLASATLQISFGDGEVAVKVILYTSTYADGTVNYICKTVFAPVEDEGRLDALADAVTNVGAVRLREE